MRILAIETSTSRGSVALLDGASSAGARPISVRKLPADRRTTKTFAPAMQELFEEAGWESSQIDVIGVTVGPGSFTGIRIGLTAAKSFAYVTGARVVALDTLRVIAEQAPSDARHVASILDAQRRQLFAALFEPDLLGTLRPVIKAHLTDLDPWRKSLPRGCTIIGDGIRLMGPGAFSDLVIADDEHWLPSAVTVGKLAQREAIAGVFHDFWSLSPVYLRASAAEEKRISN